MIEKRATGVSVEAMCGVLDISASGYYASRNRQPCEHQQADIQLGEDVKYVFVESLCWLHPSSVWNYVRFIQV